MKITASLNRAIQSDFEERKKQLARKEMGQAYKKHVKFAEASKNPMLAALENLISGQADKEHLQVDLDANKQEIAVTEKNSTPQQFTDKSLSSLDAPEQTVEVLEKIRQAALASASPTVQDLRVAKTAAQQIEEVTGVPVQEIEEEPFLDESFDLDLPEQFTKDVKRDAQAETVFGRDLEKEMFTRTFQRATSIYTSHISMVNNSYRSFNEPQISITA
jgi:hypothetical protein